MGFPCKRRISFSLHLVPVKAVDPNVAERTAALHEPLCASARKTTTKGGGGRVGGFS